MNDSHDNDGRFAQSVSDEDILWFFETSDKPVHGAGEVAEELNFSRQQAHRRLQSLEEEGHLRRLDIGARNVVWWKPRDAVVLRRERDGFSAHDLRTGVASEGESRAEALRNVAEAVAAHEGEGEEVDPADIHEQLGIDPADITRDAPLPFDQ